MPCMVNPYIYGSSYPANAVTFDGTNDYMLGAASSPYFADSGLFSASFWFRSASFTKLCYPIYGVAGVASFFVELSSPSGTGTDGRMLVFATNSAGTQILQMRADVTGGFHDGDWHHFAFSLDLSTAANRTAKFDNGNFSSVTWATYISSNIRFEAARTAMSVCDTPTAAGGVSRFSGDLADVYIAPGKNLRFDQIANLRKFISASGKPVKRAANGGYNGADIPDVWLSGETDAWHTNKGNAGGFTEFGALTTSANLPVEL